MKKKDAINKVDQTERKKKRNKNKVKVTMKKKEKKLNIAAERTDRRRLGQKVPESLDYFGALLLRAKKWRGRLSSRRGAVRTPRLTGSCSRVVRFRTASKVAGGGGER